MISSLPFWRKTRDFLSLVRFSHTVFALPFALASALWAAQGLPPGKISLLILVTMVTCRNAAMAFNRLLDARIDALNPRTAGRHLPSGRLGKSEVWLFFAANALAFIAATYFLNTLALVLSLPTLMAVCGYSLAKRFTGLSHFMLGFAIAISPVGAWVAVTGVIGAPSLWLAAALGLWIAGFDIIYATQDEAFDRKQGLHSLVVRLGIRRALQAAAWCHVLCLFALLAFGFFGHLPWPYGLAMALVALGLVYLHFFRRSPSLDALNHDFFLANAGISLVVFGGIAASLGWH